MSGLENQADARGGATDLAGSVLGSDGRVDGRSQGLPQPPPAERPERPRAQEQVGRLQQRHDDAVVATLRGEHARQQHRDAPEARPHRGPRGGVLLLEATAQAEQRGGRLFDDVLAQAAHRHYQAK